MKWKTIDLNVDDPHAVLNIYSSRLYGVDDWEKLTPEQGKNVFVHAVSDYYEHGLSLDVIINIAKFMSDKWRKQFDADFEDMLITLADLNYSLRHVTNDDKSGATVVGILKNLYNYFEKYKHQI